MSFDYSIQTLPTPSASNRYHTVHQISDDVIYFNPDGANWVNIGALGPPKAHTLASHSTKAHSELTSIGADDHHVQSHEAAHISGGGDAFTSTQLLEAIIKRIRESSGPTDLTVGAVADGEFLKRSGATIIGSAGGINAIKKTSDQTVVGVALTDITELSFSVDANADYHFYFVLVIVTNATGTGYLVTLNGPAIGSGEITYEIRLRTSNTAETAAQFGINAYQGGTFSTVGPGTTRVVAIIRGSLKNGATAGTLTVQARAEIASPGSVTVKQGSWGTWF